MEERESEVAQTSGESGNTVSDIESISDCRGDDLARMESDINKRVVHDTTTGEVIIILPSDVRQKLTVVTDDQRQCKTKVVKEDLSDIFKMCDPVSWESDFSDDEQTPAGQLEDIVTGSDWDINNNDPNLPQQNTEQRNSSLNDPRNTVCPIRGCTYISRKNKHHAQKMHLPRIMWDNPQPPVKAEKIDDLNIIRREALVYLTQYILGKSSVFALMRWVNELGYPLIPRKSQIVHKSFVQMNSLSTSVYWPTPRNRLIPMHSQSILIHWRYQAGLVQYLWQPQLEIHLCMGSSFMSDTYNLTGLLYHYARERSLLAMVVWKYCQSTVPYVHNV